MHEPATGTQSLPLCCAAWFLHGFCNGSRWYSQDAHVLTRLYDRLCALVPEAQQVVSHSKFQFSISNSKAKAALPLAAALDVSIGEAVQVGLLERLAEGAL